MDRSLLFLSIYILLLGLSCDRIFPPEVRDEYNLPSVYLEIDPDDLGILNSSIYSDRYVDAEFAYNDRESRVQLRNHGGLSRKFLKRSYRVKFDDPDLLEGKKAVVLSAQWTDKSLLRTRLSFELFRKAGLMTSENRFVSLYINNDYKGVYYLIEPVDEYFLANRDTQVGSLYKAFRGRARFTFAGGFDVRVGFEKKPVDDGNYSDLEYLINILDTVPADELMSQIDAVLHTENYLDYLAVSVLIRNADGFFSNFHLHRETFGRFEIIPWDLDMTFRGSTWTIYGSNNLSKRLLEVDAYRTYYKNRLLELLANEFSEQTMFATIDSLSISIDQAYKNDPFLKAGGCSLEEEIRVLKSFVTLRRAYIQEQLGSF